MPPMPDVVPRPDPRVVETEVDGSLVLMNLEKRRLHFLRGTAAAIWQELGDPMTLRELSERLAGRYEVDPSEVDTDIERLLARLWFDDLVTCVESPTEMGEKQLAPVRSSGGPRGPEAGSFAALDARVAIDCDDADAGELICRILSPLACAVDPTVVVRVDTDELGRWRVGAGSGDPVVVGSLLSAVLRAVSAVNDLAVESVPGHLVFHAGAVVGDRGAVVLPAASNSGKSTLTAALSRSGFGYLTDEAAAITPDLVCRPFPKSIALDPGSFPLFPDLRPHLPSGLSTAVSTREWHVDPARVGPVASPAPVQALVCPQWRPGAETRLCEVPPSEALQMLLGEAFEFASGGQAVFDILGRIVRDTPVYRLGYGDLGEAVDAVASICGRPDGVVEAVG